MDNLKEYGKSLDARFFQSAAEHRGKLAQSMESHGKRVERLRFLTASLALRLVLQVALTRAPRNEQELYTHMTQLLHRDEETRTDIQRIYERERSSRPDIIFAERHFLVVRTARELLDRCFSGEAKDEDDQEIPEQVAYKMIFTAICLHKLQAVMEQECPTIICKYQWLRTTMAFDCAQEIWLTEMASMEQGGQKLLKPPSVPRLLLLARHKIGPLPSQKIYNCWSIPDDNDDEPRTILEDPDPAPGNY